MHKPQLVSNADPWGLVTYHLWCCVQDRRPSNVTYPYDFRETSAASHRVVVTKVRKADFEHADYTGWCTSCACTLCSVMHEHADYTRWCTPCSCRLYRVVHTKYSV